MNDKSMLEVAIEIMEASNGEKNIYKLIDEVCEKLGCADDAGIKAQLYIDITTSAQFVYCGGEDELWDLKSRQSLDLWDKSFFEKESEEVVEDDEEDESDNISMEDFNYVESDEDEDEESDEDEDEDEDEVESYEIDEDADEDDEEEDSWDEDEDNSWDEDEEEKYNDMMDDYEDLYEDK